MHYQSDIQQQSASLAVQTDFCAPAAPNGLGKGPLYTLPILINGDVSVGLAWWSDGYIDGCHNAECRLIQSTSCLCAKTEVFDTSEVRAFSLAVVVRSDYCYSIPIEIKAGMYAIIHAFSSKGFVVC
jgi:hypothetical protein